MSFWDWLKPKPKFKPSTVEELVQHFNGDIIKISQWIGDNVWYRQDRVPADEWQRPTTTLTRLKGDCEDFAVLYSKVFTILDWEHWICTGHPKRGSGHAICVVDTPKGYAYTSNDRFMLSRKKDWKLVAKDSMPDMAIYWHTDCLGITIEAF